MSKPFRLRFVNEVAGFFVLASVLALVAGIFYAGRAQGWFEPKLVLHAVFTTSREAYAATQAGPDGSIMGTLAERVSQITPTERSEGAFGLQKGAEVRILNTLAGTVTEIVPNKRGDIEATFVLQGAYRRFVRDDSIALVKKKFEVFGDAYVEILPGSEERPIMPSGSYIQCRRDTEILQLALSVLGDLRDASLPAINQLRMVLEELPGLTIQIQETLHEYEQLAEALQRHWLLRKYVEQDEYGEMISPSEVGSIKGDAR